MSELLSFFDTYGLIAMFVLILAEYACFPVSSEIVLPFAGSFAASKNIPFLVLLSSSILAGLLGTSICYLVGRLGGTYLLEKLSNRFPSTKGPLSASFENFEKYGLLAVGIGRVIPLCRTYIAFVAGAFKQSYPSFFFASLGGICVWNTVLIGIGYFFRENWNIISDYYNRYKHAILLLLIILLLIFLLRQIAKDYF